MAPAIAPLAVACAYSAGADRLKTGMASRATASVILRQGYPRASICGLTSKSRRFRRLYVEPAVYSKR